MQVDLELLFGIANPHQPPLDDAQVLDGGNGAIRPGSFELVSIEHSV